MQDYSPEFKKDAVRKVLEASGKYIEIAYKTGISVKLLYEWRRIYQDEVLEEMKTDFLSGILRACAEETDIDKLLSEND
ncbi:MAG: transposase [Spirochaetes bacterium]|nr:transposase [Spirochaetota bacterium]